MDGGLNTYVYVSSNPLNYVDPLGLYKLVNCTAKLAKKIDRAVEKANAASKNCLSCDDQEKFDQELEEVIIICSPPLNSPITGTPLCGINTSDPHEFAITPEGLKELPGCGSVAATVFHETIHLIGYGHEYEDWIQGLEKRCVR